MSRNNGRSLSWREKFTIASKMIGRIHAALGGALNENTLDVARRVIAERDRVNGTLALIQKDVEIACGEFKIELPEAGTKQARILLRNRVLEAEIRKLREKAEALVEACADDKIEERHPNVKTAANEMRVAIGLEVGDE